MRYLLFTAIFCFQCTFIFGQSVNGQVDDPQMGFHFTIPDQWVGMKSADSYIITSDYKQGLIIVARGDLSNMEAVRNDLLSPVIEGAISLQPSGQLDEIDGQALGTIYTGEMQGILVKGYAINFLSQGLNGTVFAVVERDKYSNFYCDIARQIYQSVNDADLMQHQSSQTQTDQNYKPGNTGNASNLLSGYKLASINTAGGYGSTGYRKKEIINFCPDGSFTMSSNSSMVVNGDFGGGATDASESFNSGYWKFEQKNGQYFLTLTVKNESGQLPVQIYTDKYGDRRFKMAGGNFGYYGQANCK